MRRKFKKTVTMLASLTLSVAQLQTPVMAETIDHNTTNPIDTEEGDVVQNNDNGGVVKTNAGTVENNNRGGTVETNNNKVENNNSGGVITDNNGRIDTNNSGGTVTNNNEGGTITTNYGRVENNYENAQVEYNFGTIGNNEGFVGEGVPGGTANYGTIEENNFDIYLNAGEDELPEDFEDKFPDGLPEGFEYKGGHIIDNYAAVSENNGIIDNNYDTVIDNNEDAIIKDNQGTVQRNFGTINENNDTINDNFGKVKTNNGTIDYNAVLDDYYYGYVEKNRNTITVNDNGGFVRDNFGTIKENGEEGLVNINLGNIEENNGIVGNRGDLDPENFSAEDVEDYIQPGSGNYGDIDENNGVITINAGIDDADSAELDAEDKEALKNFEGGSVTTNSGLIIINNGTVETNAKSGLVFENNGNVNQNAGIVNVNNGTVNQNSGTVKTNTETGIVSNYANGVVETNTGKVYNYGGTIKDKSTGTEYFSVTIISGNNMSQSGGTNLQNYEDKKWLGQTGNTAATTEILITPFEDYYINDINIPDELKGNVSVKHNPNGSWTITVTSGINIALNIPRAKYSEKEIDRDDDTGNPPTSGNKNESNNYNPIPGTDSQGNKPQIKDNLGTVLNIDLDKILTPLEKSIDAINNFKSPVSTKNIQGYGMVNLVELFNASQGSTISVPVAANVSTGNEYTILFSDGTQMTIQCTANGQLIIPFEKGAQTLSNLTFIIYGTALTPQAGDVQEVTGPVGPSTGDDTGKKEGPVTVEKTGVPPTPGGQNESQKYNQNQQLQKSDFQYGTNSLVGSAGSDLINWGKNNQANQHDIPSANFVNESLGFSSGNDSLVLPSDNDSINNFAELDNINWGSTHFEDYKQETSQEGTSDASEYPPEIGVIIG